VKLDVSPLREEHRLRVFGSKLLRRIFGLRRVAETVDWGQSHNEKLHNLYCSQNIKGDEIMEGDMGDACSMHGRDKKLTP
jgi:hypothetical protein